MAMAFELDLDSVVMNRPVIVGTREKARYDDLPGRCTKRLVKVVTAVTSYTLEIDSWNL